MARSVLCRITTGPERDAKVLVDLNGEDVWMMHDGLTLGAPEYGVAAGELVEGTRQIQLLLSIPDKDNGRLSTWVSSRVALALAQPEAWLQWQQSPDASVTWFRLLRSSPGALSWDLVRNDHRHSHLEWPLQLTAYAFAYGERRTLTPVTVTNGSGGVASITAPDIAGDVPTLPEITLTPSNSWTNFSAMVSSVSVPESSSFTVPLVLDATSLTSITSGTSGAGAVAMGAVYGTSVVGTLPTAPPPGRYRVLARMVSTGTVSPLNPAARFAFGIEYGGDTPVWGRPRSWQSPAAGSPYNSGQAWLDLGSHNLPPNVAPRSLDRATVAPVIGIRQVLPFHPLWATSLQRLAFLPEELADGDARIAVVSFGAYGPSSTLSAVLDGPEHRVYHVNAAGSVVARPGVAFGGGMPRLVPGQRNVLTVIPQTRTDATTRTYPDVTGSTVSVGLSYHPRHLNLAGD